MDASRGSTRLRVVASRSIFSERAAVPPTAAEVSTISARSIVAGRRGVGGLVELALKGGLPRAASGQLRLRVRALRGGGQLRLGELQVLDGLAQRDRGGVVANLLRGVDQFGYGAGDVVTCRVQAQILVAMRVGRRPIRRGHPRILAISLQLSASSCPKRRGPLILPPASRPPRQQREPTSPTRADSAINRLSG